MNCSKFVRLQGRSL